MRVKDLPRGVAALHRRLERRADERGRRLAGTMIADTAAGRGVWVILLWPAWLMVFAASGAFLDAVLRRSGMAPPLSWAGFVGGLLLARAWYRADFTRRHPFWSSVAGYVGPMMAVSLVAAKLGL